jgi:hypothetical protein
MPDDSDRRRPCRGRTAPARCRERGPNLGMYELLEMAQRSRNIVVDAGGVSFALARRMLDLPRLELAVMLGEAMRVDDPENGRPFFTAVDE